MVRCGAVDHPRDWPWSGYEELMGLRRRNRLLDVDKLLWLLRVSTVEDLRSNLEYCLAADIVKDQLKRDPKWTESLAVGSQHFVEQVENLMRNRQTMEVCQDDGTWVLRESHGSIFEAENRSISLPGAAKL